MPAYGQSVIYANNIPTTPDQILNVYQGQSLNLTVAGITGSYTWVKNDVATISANGSYAPVSEGYYRVVASGIQSSNYVYVAFMQAASGKNYTKLDNIRATGIKNEASINTLSVSKLDQSVTYLDGFGRPTQQITVNSAAQTGKDLIQPFVYNAQGEQPKSYLPYAEGSNGQYKNNWLGDQSNFYTYAAKIGRPNGGATCAETLTDADPLSRIQEQAAPGVPWQLNSGHTRKQNQRVNRDSSVPDDDRVRLWTYTPGSSLGTNGTLVWSTGVAARTLKVIESLDEDGKQTVSYTNERGNVVCSRVYLSGSASFTSAANYLETNYCYDAQGRRVAVISPKATSQLLANTISITDAVDKLCFLTAYDQLGRVVAQKTPGIAWTYFVYDRWNRLAATLDPGSTASGWGIGWTYIKYDALNRPIVKGFSNDGTDPKTLAGQLQTLTDDQRFEVRAETESGYSLTHTYPFNAVENAVLTTTYYDDYDYFPIRSSSRSGLAYAVELANGDASTQTRGQTTGSRERVIDSYASLGQWLTTVNYYDEFGRALQSVQDNQTMSAKGAPAVDRTTMHYQDGLLDQSFQTHNRYSASGTLETHKVKTTNQYDAKGRLIALSESIDDSPDVQLVAYEYNELGQMVDKKLGYVQTTNGYLQSLDYRYNIRGWLTNINNRNLDENWLDSNDPNADPDASQDAFGLELQYDAAGNANQTWNGNIAAAIWNSRTPKGGMRRYGYSYDNANRFTKADYGALIFANGTYSFNGEKDALSEGRYTTQGLNYDENGNIKALQRNGVVVAPVNSAKQFGRIDDLTYEYNGNRLLTVSDGAQGGASTAAPNDFENNGSPSGQYSYDDMGNLTFDPHKQLYSYYNFQNLPVYYYLPVPTGYSYATFLYSTTGRKLQANYEQYNFNTGQNDIKTVDYIGGFAYTTDEPLTLATPVGRAVVVQPGTSTSRTLWGLEYHIRDHQGSLRMVIRQDPQVTMFTGLEPSNEQREESDFDNIASTRQFDPVHARTGEYSARLNARQAGRNTGPYTTLSVAAGDSVQIEVYGRYDGGAKTGRLTPAAVLPVVGLSLPANGAISSENPRAQTHKQPNILLGVAVAWSKLAGLFAARETELPRASLTYEFYDKDSTLISSTTQYLDEEGKQNWQLLSGHGTAKSTGYVKVFLANASGKDAWFDDFRLINTPLATIQENHYDPLGQNLVELEMTSSSDSKEQYTGQEKLSNVEGLNLYDYASRSYDFQLGRFNNIDGEASSYISQSPYNYVLNNSINYVDPDGKNPLVAMAIGAVFGGYSGYQAGSSVNAHGWDMAGYIIGGAAIGAASGYVGGSIAEGGGSFAKTRALIWSSTLSSGGMSYLTGGRTHVKTDFAIASFDFTAKEFDYVGKEGNSSLDNIGLALSALTVVSDYVNSGANKTLESRNAALERVPPSEGYKAWFKSHYIGPGPDVDPRKMLGSIPITTDVDKAAYFHDIAYYEAGANGIPGALFSTKVIGADFKLAAGALRALPSSVSTLIKYPSWTTFNTFAASALITPLFTGLGTMKTGINYSYLLTTLR